MGIPTNCKITLIKIAAKLFDIRGLRFINAPFSETVIGFRLHFYRRAPDNFYEWLCGRGVIVDEREYEDDGNTQYNYILM
jgi:hypothetical protein